MILKITNIHIGLVKIYQLKYNNGPFNLILLHISRILNKIVFVILVLYR